MTHSSPPTNPGKTRADQLASRYRDSFAMYQYAFIDFLLDHLTDLARTFAGDLHLPVLLAHVGQARLQAVILATKNASDLTTLPPAATGISASRLTDISGIPRETVRRKLQKLKSAGWIDQLPSGAWYLIVDPDAKDSPARRDLASLDERAVNRVATLVARLEPLDRGT